MPVRFISNSVLSTGVDVRSDCFHSRTYSGWPWSSLYIAFGSSLIYAAIKTSRLMKRLRPEYQAWLPLAFGRIELSWKGSCLPYFFGWCSFFQHLCSRMAALHPCQFCRFHLLLVWSNETPVLPWSEHSLIVVVKIQSSLEFFRNMLRMYRQWWYFWIQWCFIPIIVTVLCHPTRRVLLLYVCKIWKIHSSYFALFKVILFLLAESQPLLNRPVEIDHILEVEH